MLFPIAIIEKDGKYYGHLPDMPTIDITEVISSARLEVINHLQNLADTDEPIPEGSDVANYLASGEYAGWTWAIIHINPSRIIGEDITISLNIPERLMQKITNQAQDDNCQIEPYIISLLKKALQ